jgi:hypothetical protein
MPQEHFRCYSCGKTMEFSTWERPCEVLRGWLTVAQWKGLGAVEHYNFCSFTCLKRWVDTQVPQVPEVFPKAFGEGKDK